MLEIDADGWDARFTSILDELRDVIDQPPKQVAALLANRHPREAMMAAVAWATLGPTDLERTIDYLNDGNLDSFFDWHQYRYQWQSTNVMCALLPLLDVQFFDEDIKEDLTEPENPCSDEYCDWEDRKMGVVRRKFEMLWRLHYEVEAGATVEEAMAALTEDGCLTPESAPEWRVAQPPYWDAL